MHIEASVDETLLRTLTFGCFPKNILSFQDSQDYIEQIAFVDYQLELLIQNELSGVELSKATQEQFSNDGIGAKLESLIEYAVSISANYNDHSKTYHQSLYYTTVLSHLYYLNSQRGELQKTLSSIYVTSLESVNGDNVNGNHSSSTAPVKKSTSGAAGKTQTDEFIKYMTTRYRVIQGFSDLENSITIWNEYLSQWQPYFFNKSNVAAHRWLEIMFDKFSYILTTDGSSKIEFQTLRQIPFAENKNSLIAFCNYLSRHQNKERIASKFRSEYGGWLSKTLEYQATEKLDTFPHASSTESSRDLNSFVDNLFEGLGSVPYYYLLLKPSSAKKFLIHAMHQTYQSQTVLSSFIKTLLDLREYDEAYAAMKTYVSYIEKGQEQHMGHVDNILSIIETYTACIIAFNPLESFISEKNKGKEKKFKYTTNYMVVKFLHQLGADLIKYLGILAEICGLSYDLDEKPPHTNEETNEAKDQGSNRLSFLYKKYNINVLLGDRSSFIDLISKAWFSLGKFAQYLATYEAPNEDKLKGFTSQVLMYYKNGLIVNATGNCELLFNYALALSYNSSLHSASKLCKFILKKYPESFKTWNLLVLILTSFESYNPDKIQDNDDSTTIIEESRASNSTNGGWPSRESEKLIANALNIAAIFIEKYNSKSTSGGVTLSEETKYQIIQLKLTQLAVWESIHGTPYILEYLPDLFELFHELFDIDLGRTDQDGKDKPKSNMDSAWSHRPSVIDPKVKERPVANGRTNGHANGNGHNNVENNRRKSNDIDFISDKLKNLSRLKSRDRKAQSELSRREIDNVTERRLLQELWLWTSNIYAKLGNFEEAEQCIVESETVYEPNVKSNASLGLLTSKTRKFLSLQEFEKSLEILGREEYYSRKDFGTTLLGLCKLFIIDDEVDNSLFISTADMNAGVIRLKNYLEKYTNCWPYGSNNPEVWWYLSLIYERIDDKILLNKSLWKCIDLEDFRPVRAFSSSAAFEFS
ncbi:hypothetical protein CAAN1_18S00452 [[Candida] anglica]|uniref:Cargo-transport protein YPP1 n=1 Tax=[Candida] anglica TaxID=148631 RepID=A0ABP0ELR2_9ASCO